MLSSLSAVKGIHPERLSRCGEGYIMTKAILILHDELPLPASRARSRVSSQFALMKDPRSLTRRLA